MRLMGFSFGFRLSVTASFPVVEYLFPLVPQAALSIHGMCGGPMLGLFSLGILFPVTNLKVNLNLHTRNVNGGTDMYNGWISLLVCSQFWSTRDI